MSEHPTCEHLTCEQFAGRLGDVFHFAVGEHSFALKLVEATSEGRSPRSGGAFSLIFIGPATPVLRQAIYPLRHDALGEIAIFIVPIGWRDGGMSYQAVFS